jgi:hypothetical protein
MGVYLINAARPRSGRDRRTDVLHLILGSYGSNMSELVEAIGLMMLALETGLHININGEPTFVCAFTMASTSDMLQQQKNSQVC